MAHDAALSLQLTARYVSLLHSLELSRPPPSPVSLDLTLLALTTSVSLFLLPLSSCLPLPPSSFFVLFMLLVSVRPTCRPYTSLFLPSSSTRRISILCTRGSSVSRSQILFHQSGMACYCSYADPPKTICSSFR